MVRLDMSEYMERHSVSKLIGSPPGYVGFGEGGTLTEAIRRRPFTVVVLDEIEKAHPDIFNILLQIFEDGHLTDSQVCGLLAFSYSWPKTRKLIALFHLLYQIIVDYCLILSDMWVLQGRRVSFKNALVVMTSNVGSTIIAKGRQSSIGFVLTDGESSSYAGIKATVMEELKSYFRPELLNRIDEVVVFHPLEKSQVCHLPVVRIIMSLALGFSLMTFAFLTW